MKGAEVVWLEPNCQAEQKGWYCCGRSPSHHGCMTPPLFRNGMVLLVFWLPTLSDLLLPSRFSIPCCFKWWKRRVFFLKKKLGRMMIQRLFVCWCSVGEESRTKESSSGGVWMRGIIVNLSPGLGFFVMSKVSFFLSQSLNGSVVFFTAGTRDGARYAGAGGAFGFGFVLFFSLANRGHVMVQRLFVAFGHEEGSVDILDKNII
jgi:hypothetical protein